VSPENSKIAIVIGFFSYKNLERHGMFSLVFLLR